MLKFLDHLPEPRDLCTDGVAVGCRQPAGAAAVARRDGHLGTPRVLDEYRPGRNEAGDLGVAELFEQPEHVAVDRLFPEPFALCEIATHARGVDPRVERSR